MCPPVRAERSQDTATTEAVEPLERSSFIEHLRRAADSRIAEEKETTMLR
jgi:hypothetical protein